MPLLKDKITEICALELKASTDPDPALFDRITGQLAAAGVAIDLAATASARTESPNVIAVFELEDAGERWLNYIETIAGEVDIYEYYGKIEVELATLEKYAGYNYDDYIRITKADVAGLRYIERAGQPWYDENELDTIHARKDEERRARREAMSKVALVLPPEFLDLCEEVKQEPAAILQGFIADLCHLYGEEYNSHGSDERDMAEAYFDRVGYRWWSKEEGEGGNDKG